MWFWFFVRDLKSDQLIHSNLNLTYFENVSLYNMTRRSGVYLEVPQGMRG